LYVEHRGEREGERERERERDGRVECNAFGVHLSIGNTCHKKLLFSFKPIIRTVINKCLPFEHYLKEM